MKRGDKRHDDVWFLGVSGYQWSFGILPMSVPCFIAGLVGKEPSLLPGAISLLVLYAIAWCAWLVPMLLLCVLTNTAHADRDPEFESGLVSIPIEGSQVLPGPSYSRPQLLYKDTHTATTVGTAAAIGGSLSLLGGWVVYVASQNYRLKIRSELGDSVETWQTQRRWALTLAGFGAANLITSELTLLDGAKPPLLAWIGGVAGVATAAIGVGFAVGGTHCSPIAVRPSAEIPIDCLSGTADAAFGPLILLSGAPLLALPLTYALRGLFAGRPESLTFDGTGVRWVRRF